MPGNLAFKMEIIIGVYLGLCICLLIAVRTFRRETASYGIGRDEIKDGNKMEEKVKERERTQRVCNSA